MHKLVVTLIQSAGLGCLIAAGFMYSSTAGVAAVGASLLAAGLGLED